MKRALALLLIAAPARADYWTSLLEPDRARAVRLVREGNAQLSPALALGLLSSAGLPVEFAAQRAVAVEGARARFALAKQLYPSLREARLAYALTLGEDDEPSRRAAIEELEALRALDPLYEAEQVAFQLGILHARGGELDAARLEYERALALHCDEHRQPTVLLDLAEVLMFQGELARARALYERAAREADPNGRVLALWGSAVVLDRMGEHAQALVTARRAIASDRAPFAALQRAGVFFVPEYERDYYEALGHLALAELERSQEDTRELLAELHKYRPRRNDAHALRALRSFDRYLMLDGGRGPYAEDAREHILELTRP
jgi:tetratricopeptide (TPR) repeat protein